MAVNQSSDQSFNPMLINGPATSVEHQVVNHALKSGYISSQQLRNLTTWYRSTGQQAAGPESSPLLSKLCSSLSSTQVEDLKLFYQRLKNADETNTIRPRQSTIDLVDTLQPSSVTVQHVEDQRPHIICELKELLTQYPRFSPSADLFFERKEKLGEGGMGAVYRVHDTRIGRDAALKVINDEIADNDAISRFVREVEITARLDHPSIPPVYEAGTNKNGEHYMLMRVIEGEELADLIKSLHEVAVNYKKDSLKIRELLEVLVKVGEAVAYAHSQGILHRDLKPSNILVGQFGEVMVMDWGLAKKKGMREDGDMAGQHDRAIHISEAQAKKAGLTQAGLVMGTPGYMPPEQADDCASVDERADVFALAAILSEILTGKTPISGKAAFEKVMLTLKGQISIPSDIHRGVPKELNAIAAHALEADSEERTESVEDFISDLKAYLIDEPVAVYQYGVLERMLRFGRRYPALMLGSPIFAVLLILVSFLGWQLSSAEIKLKKTEEIATKTVIELEKTTEKAVVNQRELDKIKQVLFWFNKARNQIQREMTLEEIKTSIDKGLRESNRSSATLLTAAKIYDEGRFNDEVKQLLNEVIKKDSKAYEALFYLHKIELAEKRGTAVMTAAFKELLKRAQEHGDENEFTLLASGIRLFAQKKYAAAIEKYIEIEKYTKRFSWSYINRGLARLKLGDINGAIVDYNRAIEINPRDFEALYSRANLQIISGDDKAALVDFSKAIEVNPRYHQAYNNRGVVRCDLGDKKGAIDDYNKAIEINPRYDEAYNNRGNARSGLGDNNGAILDYNKAIEINPRSAKSYNNRGAARLRSGDTKGATDDYNKAVEINPRSAEAYANLGLIQYSFGRKRAAALGLKRFLELVPNHPAAPRMRALLSKIEAELKNNKSQ
jgi:serine/threonine protein kinase/regulator of sirC expression with transglutaminase-like and TPR domain